MASERVRDRLVDYPGVRRPAVDQDRFGSFAEQFARFMGTARFLIYMTLFVAVWIVWNLVVPEDLRWDDYPFIFLTLMLSLQASYAAPLILLAQNRQADRDRVQYQEDRSLTDRLVARTGDARVNLRSLPEASQDLVIGDAFGGEAVPWHLTTVEFVEQIRAEAGNGPLTRADLAPIAAAGQ